MTNESTSAPRIRLGMIVLYVRDLGKSIAFYRALGIDVSDPDPRRPVASHRFENGVTLLLTTDLVARIFDPAWARTDHGYQQVVEFFVDDDGAVDAAWQRLTAAGYRGTRAPGNLVGPYATLVEDPDGNVVLITSEPA
jgi:predicted lactoylglutathione lyase